MLRGRDVHGVDEYRRVRRVVIMYFGPRRYCDGWRLWRRWAWKKQIPKKGKIYLVQKQLSSILSYFYCALAAGLNIHTCLGAWEPRPRADKALSVFSYDNVIVLFRITLYYDVSPPA